MLHLLGIIFIIGGMTGLGISYLEKEKQRINLLETWEYISEMYISEISYKKQMLSLASIEIGKKVQGMEGRVLVNIGEKLSERQEDFFQKIWQQEWKKVLKECVLRKEEKNMILDFSLFTGFESEDIQMKMIENQREKFKRIRELAQEENKEKKKVILVLSFSAGMLLVLILL